MKKFYAAVLIIFVVAVLTVVFFLGVQPWVPREVYGTEIVVGVPADWKLTVQGDQLVTMEARARRPFALELYGELYGSCEYRICAVHTRGPVDRKGPYYSTGPVVVHGGTSWVHSSRKAIQFQLVDQHPVVARVAMTTRYIGRQHIAICLL